MSHGKPVFSTQHADQAGTPDPFLCAEPGVFLQSLSCWGLSWEGACAVCCGVWVPKAACARPGLHSPWGHGAVTPSRTSTALPQAPATLCTQGQALPGLWAHTVHPKQDGRLLGSPCASWQVALSFTMSSLEAVTFELALAAPAQGGQTN